MRSKDKTRHWSVFDSIRFLPATPDALMSEINAAIAALEYAHATALLHPSSSSLSSVHKSSNQSATTSVYSTEIAEEAYKLGCAALSEGKVDEGLHSLNLSLAKCPPEQTDVAAKVQSLISLAARHFQISSK